MSFGANGFARQCGLQRNTLSAQPTVFRLLVRRSFRCQHCETIATFSQKSKDCYELSFFEENAKYYILCDNDHLIIVEVNNNLNVYIEPKQNQNSYSQSSLRFLKLKV